MRRNCQPNSLCIFLVNFSYFPTKFAPENCNFAANFIIFLPNLLLKTHSYLIAARGIKSVFHLSLALLSRDSVPQDKAKVSLYPSVTLTTSFDLNERPFGTVKTHCKRDVSGTGVTVIKGTCSDNAVVRVASAYIATSFSNLLKALM